MVRVCREYINVTSWSRCYSHLSCRPWNRFVTQPGSRGELGEDTGHLIRKSSWFLVLCYFHLTTPLLVLYSFIGNLFQRNVQGSEFSLYGTKKILIHFKVVTVGKGTQHLQNKPEGQEVPVFHCVHYLIFWMLSLLKRPDFMLFKMLRSSPPIGDVSDRTRRTSLNRKDLSGEASRFKERGHWRERNVQCYLVCLVFWLVEQYCFERV